MNPVSGSELLATALAANPETIAIVITGKPSVEGSLEVLRAGAWDYLPKPFTGSQLQILVGRAAHAVAVARESRVLHEQHGVQPGDRVAVLGNASKYNEVIPLAPADPLSQDDVGQHEDRNQNRESDYAEDPGRVEQQLTHCRYARAHP